MGAGRHRRRNRNEANLFRVVGAVLIVGGLLSQSSRGQDPVEILEHYRLVPRASVLHQTGGIAGVDQRYRLTGEYDFRHGLRPLRWRALKTRKSGAR